MQLLEGRPDFATHTDPVCTQDLTDRLVAITVADHHVDEARYDFGRCERPVAVEIALCLRVPTLIANGIGPKKIDLFEVVDSQAHVARTHELHHVVEVAENLCF